MGCFLASAALQPMEVGVGIAALKVKEGRRELRGHQGPTRAGPNRAGPELEKLSGCFQKREAVSGVKAAQSLWGSKEVHRLCLTPPCSKDTRGHVPVAPKNCFSPLVFCMEGRT